MKKVLVFGTFDGLHEGHLNFFTQARENGDYLAVVVGRDSTVLKVKGKLPTMNENDRLKAVEACDLVDFARLGNEDKPPHAVIGEVKPDIICLGYDQMMFTDKLEEKIKEMGLVIPIVRLEAYKPEIYKSSLLNK